MVFLLSLLLVIAEASEQPTACANSADCKSIERAVCKDSVCSPCSSHTDCRNLMQGSRRNKVGLFFCDKDSGQCQGILGKDDITGYGNNQKNPILGTVNDHAIRNCPSSNPIKPKDSPSVRTLSNEMCNRPIGDESLQKQSTFGGKVLNVFTVFFGQFVDHEITLMGEKTDDNITMDSPAGDTLGKIFLPKNAFENDDINKPELEITSYIDGSAVYGSDPYHLNSLRESPEKACAQLTKTPELCEPDCTLWKPMIGSPKCIAKLTCQQRYMDFGDCDEDVCEKRGKHCVPIPGFGVNGLLRTNRYNDEDGREMLPTKGRSGGACDGATLESGDERTGENTVLMMFHTLFFREHNRIAREFKEANPEKKDLEVFSFARKLVRHIFQKIIYEEWLPKLIGEGKLEYKGYDPNASPQIAMEFAGSAFRWGHSALPEYILVKDGTSIPLSNAFSNAKPLFENFNNLLTGVLVQPMEKVNGQAVEEVRNILFRDLQGQDGVIHPHGPEDLMTRNKLRGRMLELATFQEFYQCPVYAPFFSDADRKIVEDQGIDTTADVLEKLKKVYNVAPDQKLDRIDLFTAMMIERRFDSGDPDSPGFSKALIAAHLDQFNRLQHADRFFYKHPDMALSDNEKTYVSKNFAELIRRNTGVAITGDVFAIDDFDFSKFALPTTDCKGECLQKDGSVDTDCPKFCGKFGKCCRLGVKQEGCNHEREGIAKEHRCVPNGLLPTSENGLSAGSAQSSAVSAGIAALVRGPTDKKETGTICPVTVGLNDTSRTCQEPKGKSKNKFETVDDGKRFEGQDFTGESACNSAKNKGTGRCPSKTPVMCNQKTGYDNHCAATEEICNKNHNGVLPIDQCPSDFDKCADHACKAGTSKKFNAANLVCPAHGCENEYCCNGEATQEIECSLDNCKKYVPNTAVPEGECVRFCNQFWRSVTPDADTAPGEGVSQWSSCGTVPRCSPINSMLPDNSIPDTCFNTRDVEGGDQKNLFNTDLAIGALCYHTCQEGFTPTGHFHCIRNGELRNVEAGCKAENTTAATTTTTTTTANPDHKDCKEKYLGYCFINKWVDKYCVNGCRDKEDDDRCENLTVHCNTGDSWMLSNCNKLCTERAKNSTTRLLSKVIRGNLRGSEEI